MTCLIRNKLICNHSIASGYLALTRYNRSSKMSPKTAGIIGDEILKGDVLDTNSNFMAKNLHQMGIAVQKISIIGDTVDEISKETLEFSNNYDYVLTTGGIGPTHDDRTFEGIAKAFNEELKLNPSLVKLVSDFYKTDDLNAPGMKLALVPESAHLTFATDKQGKACYPNVSVRNVYIFPGIPQLMIKLFELVAHKLFSSNNKFYLHVVYLNVTEQLIVNSLDQVVKEYPDVMFGSYPELFNEKFKVRITIESTNPALTEAATKKLLELVPKDFIA